MRYPSVTHAGDGDARAPRCTTPLPPWTPHDGEGQQPERRGGSTIVVQGSVGNLSAAVQDKGSTRPNWHEACFEQSLGTPAACPGEHDERLRDSQDNVSRYLMSSISRERAGTTELIPQGPIGNHGS